MSTDPSYHDSNALTRQVYQAMERAGIDAEAFMAELGLSPEAIEQRDRRTLHERIPHFWERLEQETGDTNIGLHVGRFLPTFGGEVLEYLFLSSMTFGEGLDRALRYQALLSGAAMGSLSLDGETAILTIDSALPAVNANRHLYECLSQGIIGFFRSVTDGSFTPRRTEFAAPAPESSAEEQQYLQCDLAYDSPHNCIRFDVAVLDRPSPHAEPRLVELHERVAEDRLKELDATDFVIAARRAIARELERGTPSLAQVAERLHVPQRELRSRLAAADTSFNKELDRYRERLACRLLYRTNQSIDEIVYLTGFSEPSTFYRAFRRWRDETPIQYRQRMRQRGKSPAPAA